MRILLTSNFPMMTAKLNGMRIKHSSQLWTRALCQQWLRSLWQRKLLSRLIMILSLLTLSRLHLLRLGPSRLNPLRLGLSPSRLNPLRFSHRETGIIRGAGLTRLSLSWLSLRGLSVRRRLKARSSPALHQPGRNLISHIRA